MKGLSVADGDVPGGYCEVTLRAKEFFNVTLSNAAVVAMVVKISRIAETGVAVLQRILNVLQIKMKSNN